MKKKLIVTTVFSVLICVVGFTPFRLANKTEQQSLNRERKIQKTLLKQIVSFQNYVHDSLYVLSTQPNVSEQKIRSAFLKVRLLYKNFEWASEYFTADLARRVNGPPVPEIENADLLDPTLAYTIGPMGLQLIETLIYPEFRISNKARLTDEIKVLIHNTEYLLSYFTDQTLDDWRILDAAKMEVFRIISLGVSGFDCQLAENSIAEAAQSLQSLDRLLSHYTTEKKSGLSAKIQRAIRYLKFNADFNTFDRAEFITDYANPITSEIFDLEEMLPGRKIKYNRMLNQEVSTMFDSGAFNANAFAPGSDYFSNEAKIKLGEKLFYDVSLSGTGTRSCATCHKPELDFTDGLIKNSSLADPGKLLPRNTPTLLNVALQSNYFYDLRTLTLEDQARTVINNPDELGSSVSAIKKYFFSNREYRELFSIAFPEPMRKTDTSLMIFNAIASFERSLTLMNSRFDAYMRGNKKALTAQELHGFNLFMGKAKCATCHFMPVFNGTTPPKFVKSEAEVLGVPRSFTDSVIDPDLGYYNIIGVAAYKYGFKTPTVRNITRTAPYMHNGVFQTLEEVMNFYNNGGGAGLGIKLPNQTLSEEKLDLSQSEISDIIAFMKSLESR